MSDLLAGDSITCSGATFQNFHNFVSNASGGADAPTADEVFVTAVNCDPTNMPNPTLIFQSANWNVNSGQTIDTAFSFDVVGSVSLIQLALLAFDAQSGGQIHIEESVFDALNNNIVNLSVDTLGGPIIDTHDLGAVYGFLRINKNVGLEGHAGGNAAVSTFTQTYVPEPGSASLAAIGIAAVILASVRARRRMPT